MAEIENSRIRWTWKSLLLVAVLPFLSGAAALSHELLWTRRLVDLLGATDWVIGRVLGLFFLGIALGGYLASLPIRTDVPAIKKLLLAELFIGLLALPAAFLPFWTDWIWVSLGTDALVSWQGAVIKLLLAVVIVLPPSIAMGFTLPFFIRSATDQGSDVSSIGIWIYALNTLGGVAGLWFTSTFLVGWLGAQWAMLIASSVNGLIALSIFSFLLREKSESRPQRRARRKLIKKQRKLEGSDSDADQDTKTELGVEPMSRWGLLSLSFISGFVVLSLEVLLLRLIALVVPSSYHTTSALLANVILILAFSSGLVSLANSFAATRNIGKSKWLVVGGFVGAAVFVCLCPLFLFESTDKLISIRYLQGLNGRTIESVGHYWTLVFWLIASSSGLALLCSGLVFPSLMTMSSEIDPSGKKIGSLLAVNGIGGLLGSELFNSVLIGVVGVYQCFVLLAALLLVFAVWMTFKLNRGMALGVSIILSAVVFFGFTKCRDLPYLSPRTTVGFEISARHFSREGVWLIVEKEANQSKSILVNNQYILGGSGAALNQRRQLLLPWVIHPTAKSVCSLGLATGISASGLEDLEDPPPVTAVELSNTVEKLAKQYFEADTRGFFERKENQVVVEDARTYIAAASDEYDLIVGDLYRPHGTGEGRLFSVEHFENVRAALTEEGIFCQWLPVYQLNDTNWLTIAATFQSVFPETMVIYGNLDVRYPVIGLVGRKNDRNWQAEELAERFDKIPEEILEIDPLLKSARGLVAGVLKPDVFENQTVNTLDNLRVEISAGDFWILKDLRKNRPVSYESEFLIGKQLIEFNRRLDSLVTPILPSVHFQQFKAAVESKVQQGN